MEKEISEITEGNRLIAEFMGAKKRYFLKYSDGQNWKHYGEKISDTPFKDVPFKDNIHQSGRNMTKYKVLQHHLWQMHPNDENGQFDSWLKYHSDWNLLMPVVEKIENLGGSFQIYKRKVIVLFDTINHNYTELELLENPTMQYQTDYFNSGKLLKVWECVIEFIKWYNENNKQ